MSIKMGFAISTPTSSLLHSCTCLFVSVPKNAMLEHVPQLGFGPFCQWNGLKQLSISISKYSVNMERKGRRKVKGVYASLFGVGAPEALVIGVVALLIFGPKGLAQLARSFGKTLRGFQPTIKELQEVSREFKSTLEREIGLDEINNQSYMSRTPPDFTDDSETNVVPKISPQDDDDSPSDSGAYTTDEYLKVTEAQLKGALARLQEEEKERPQSELQTPSQNSQSNALEQEQGASILPPGPGQAPQNET